MMINNLFQDAELYVPVPCTGYPAAEPSPSNRLLTKEHTLTLYANGQALHRFVCSPAQLTELCLGWLCGEGYIQSAAEAESLHISEDGHTANVTLPSLCRRAPAVFPADTTPDMTLCEQAAHTLLQEETTYTRTRGTHGCVYAAGGSVVVFCEDIGRYNALDKTIGTLLLRGEAPGEGMLFSSGRIFVGMVEKTVRAGIPVLASKAAATADAVAAANQYHQTLLFFANGSSFVQSSIL